MIVYIMSGMSVIYRITDSNNNFYIGSTSNLKQRLRDHRRKDNHISSKILCDDWTCDILEHTDKVGHDLLWLERKYFDAHYGNPLFVNKQKPIITDEERILKRREINNASWHRNYHRNKAYYEENKAYYAKKCKEYYDKYKAYKGQKLHCECGAVVRRDYMTKHLKTKKHFKLIQSKNGQNDEKMTSNVSKT